MSGVRVIEGRYALVRSIGRGRSGHVYVAERLDEPEDGDEARVVALKLVPTRPRLPARALEELQKEMTAPLRVAHPGVLSLLDVGWDPSGPHLYLAMELLHGETLRELMERADPTLAARRVDVLEAALEPLAAVHAKGFLHADLSPSNVFAARRRTGEERVVLLDLALRGALSRPGILAPGAETGTTRFMAPEQLRGERVGPSADVWAWGAMLYEAIAERPAFAGLEHPAALAHHIATVPHVPLEEVCPDADVSLARLVDLCLAKEPSQRPADARALMRTMKGLRGVQSLLDLQHTVLDASGAAPEPPPEELDLALRRAPRDPRVHRALLAHYQGEGNTDGVWLASSALDFLGEATREEIRLHHHYRRPAHPPPDRGVDASGWAALLHPDQDPRVDAVWAEVVDALAAMHARGDDELELGQARKLDLGKPTEPLSRLFARAISALRPGVVPRLYRGAVGTLPKHLPSRPPASIFPRGFEEPLPEGALGFAVGRHVACYRAAHRVATLLMEPDALEVMFDAAIGIGLGWSPSEPARAGAMRALDAHLAPARREALRVAAARLGAAVRHVDLGSWRRAVELSASRAGLLLAADLDGAAWMLRWNRERRRIPTEDATDDLLSFWSSGAHVRLRHLLGLALGASR